MLPQPSVWRSRSSGEALSPTSEGGRCDGGVAKARKAPATSGRLFPIPTRQAVTSSSTGRRSPRGAHDRLAGHGRLQPGRLCGQPIFNVAAGSNLVAASSLAQPVTAAQVATEIESNAPITLARGYGELPRI